MTKITKSMQNSFNASVIKMIIKVTVKHYNINFLILFEETDFEYLK